MSNDTTPERQDNSNTIALSIDSQLVRLPMLQLASGDVQQQLAESFSQAEHVIIHEWNRVVQLPAQIHEFFLSLYQSEPEKWVYQIAGRDELFTNPFDATLNSFVSQANASEVARATSLAMEAAAIVCPNAASDAAARIRDWLDRHGVRSEPARTIAAQIRSNTSGPDRDAQLSPQDAARMLLAEMQAEREARGEEITTPPLVYYQHEYHIWNGTTWKKCAVFEREIVRRLQRLGGPTSLTTNFVRSVDLNIQGLTFLDHSEARLPFRVEYEPSRELTSCEMLRFENGLLDISSLQSVTPELRVEPHTAEVFGAPNLDYVYDATAACPTWLRTLEEIFPPTGAADQRMAVLQEFFGYCLLMSNHRFEAFLILIGDGANGKSVILEVLRAMLGSANVSNVPLDALEGRFNKVEMIGKLANIATDMQRMPKVQEGTLKQMVSGEPLQVEQKHKPAYTAYPTAKLVFATNHLPPFADTSDGLWRRMIVIPFFVQFVADRIDRYRARDIISEELPGVLNWALEGASRLLQQDQFTSCGACDAAKHEHRHDSDPFRQFLDECCELGPDYSVVVDEFYKAYSGFCRESGKGAKAKSEVGKLMAKLNEVDRRRDTEVGRRYYVYHGIRLLPTVMAAQLPGDPRRQEYQPARRMSRDVRLRPTSDLAGPVLGVADQPDREEDPGQT